MGNLLARNMLVGPSTPPIIPIADALCLSKDNKNNNGSNNLPANKTIKVMIAYFLKLIVIPLISTPMTKLIHQWFIQQ